MFLVQHCFLSSIPWIIAHTYTHGPLFNPLGTMPSRPRARRLIGSSPEEEEIIKEKIDGNHFYRGRRIQKHTPRVQGKYPPRKDRVRAIQSYHTTGLVCPIVCINTGIQTRYSMNLCIQRDSMDFRAPTRYIHVSASYTRDAPF